MPPDILGYGGWLAALIVAAHIVIRLVAPYADPVLLPVVAALNGLGLAVIHRLDLADEVAGRKADYAQQQLIWMTLGVVLFVVTLLVLRDHRVLAALHLHPRPGRDRAAAAAAGAGHRHRDQRRPDLDPARRGFSFQPGEVAKVLLVIAFAGYLVLHRDALALAGRRLLFVDLPRGRDLGPILAMWLVSLGILVFQRDLGSSLLFFGLFLMMLYVATERPGWLVVGGLLFAAGATAAYFFVFNVRIRVDFWLNPFDFYGQSTGSGPAGRGDVRHGLGRPDRARLRRRRPLPDPVRRLRLHRRRDRRGARADRRHGGADDVRPDRRARAAHRADLPRRASASWSRPVSPA